MPTSKTLELEERLRHATRKLDNPMLDKDQSRLGLFAACNDYLQNASIYQWTTEELAAASAVLREGGRLFTTALATSPEVSSHPVEILHFGKFYAMVLFPGNDEDIVPLELLSPKYTREAP